MQATQRTNLTRSQKRNIRRTKVKTNPPSYGPNHVENNSKHTITIEPKDYPHYARLTYLCRIMTTLTLGTNSNVETETRIRGNNKNDFWLLFRINRFENEHPKPLSFHNLKVNLEDYTAALFLYEKGIHTGKVWIAIHSSDPFLIIRNDRFLYTEGKYCQIPDGVLSDKYNFQLVSDMGMDFKGRVDREKILAIFSDREINIPPVLCYWSGHHDKESKYFVCERTSHVGEAMYNYK